MTELLKDIFQNDRLLRDINGVLLWEEVIEDKIKKHTRALKLQKKTLHVLADSSMWSNELNFFKKEIINKINKKAGSKIVDDIRFKVGGIE